MKLFGLLDIAHRWEYVWICELIMLSAGCLLIARGHKIYKALQVIICMLFFAGIGFVFQEMLPEKIWYGVLLLLAVVGCLIGLRYYRIGLFLLASISSYVVVFSHFWHRAFQHLQVVLDFGLEKKEMMSIFFANSFQVQEVVRAFGELSSADYGEMVMQVENALALIRKGMLWAGIVAIIFGVFVLIFGDFIIRLVTSGLGATIIIGLVEDFIILTPALSLVLLLVLMGLGVVIQSNSGS